ncbi:MAG: hypothetical protein E6Q85_00440 [Thiothrix sp.]|nr:MAG: hypothetical protein E6Q85_00440 [Thiothrix sp.]
MQTTAKNSALFLALITTISACDKKVEAIQGFNIKPQITIATTNRSSKSITDSMRICALTTTVKRLKVSYHDGNKNIAQVVVKSSSNHAVLKYGGRSVKDFLPIDQNELDLDFENTQEEHTRLDFTITDKLGASDHATYNLFTFKNLAPIALLEYQLEKDGKYILDASKSYDQDRNYGGKIAWYIFKINDHEIKSRNPTIAHFLNEKGSHQVALTVIDNLGQSSTTISKTIDFNPR